MWLCLREGFLSVVANKDYDPKVDTSELIVRARVKEHISNYFPKVKILEWKGTDYRFRAFISKDELKSVLATYVDELYYTNFKDSVKDDKLHDFYLSVWYEGVKSFAKRFTSSFW
jgi:hypothetical protein